MRILHVVAGEKWTGVAAVVVDWTRALVESGVEAQCAFVADGPLARRILPAGWARPLLSAAHGPFGLLQDPGRLRQTIRRERVDVLHAHLTHDHALAVLAARETRARVVRTIHHRRHLRRDPLTRWLWSRTTRFAFANREIAGASGRPGPVHAPAIRLETFAPGPRPATLPGMARMPAGALVLGTVGKLAPGRGFEEAIDAAAPVSSAVLLHVGQPTPHGESLRSRARERGAEDRNFWPGYQDATLALFYRAMDVFVFPASGSQQGQRALLEAMASGVPVAALDAPGVRDLVTDGVEGFVARDVPGLTEAIRRLSDPALREAMGAAGRRRARDFSAPALASALRAFYG